MLGAERAEELRQLRVMNGALNMTELALQQSGFINGVSLRHREVSRAMYKRHYKRCSRRHLDRPAVARLI